MRILFLSISSAVSDLSNRGIYPDLVRYFGEQGHELYIVSPFERRLRKKTKLVKNKNFINLCVKTLNLTKANFIEKGIATLILQFQYKVAIRKFLKEFNFDLILYSTPPITFNSLVRYLKTEHNAISILLLKDIFPQNAVDLGMIKHYGLIYKYFRNIEKRLYGVSDFIGCMSPANIEYILKNNPTINKGKLFICPNAIDIVERKFVNYKSLRLYHKIPLDVTLFIFSGNLGKPQGIDMLLRILDEFKNREDCFFLIIGSGTESNKIKKWKNEQFSQNVLYYEMMNRFDYEKIEECCDVGMVFLDSRFTIPNFPSRILSYLECKLPILFATDSFSDVGKIALENNFGLWSPSDNLDLIINNVEFMIANKQMRKQMGLNGYNYLVKNYHVSNAYDSIMRKINF